MKISYDPSTQISLTSSAICLLQGKPVINGQVIGDAFTEIVNEDNDGFTLRYTTQAQVRFSVNVHQASSTDYAWLSYSVEGLDLNTPLDSFGIQFEALENLRAYLRSGYNSWDGSEYVEPEVLASFEPGQVRPEIGFAMTQLLPRRGGTNLLLGFDRHDRFQHTFTFDTRSCPTSLTILTLWDRKDRLISEPCESERLVILENNNVEAGLIDWARIVAGAAPQPPRIKTSPITGWCSWYNLYPYISEEIILEHLAGVDQVVRSQALPMRVFQIDEGFSPEMGDWLEVRPQFPRGMKPVLDDIRRAGFVPGLWIGPFMVGNRSRLFCEHPDWVVHDRVTGGPLVQWRLYGEWRWGHRSEEYYILDATHPEAFEYLRQVFHTWRTEWGCDYFKTDFMFYGSEYGPERALWHQPGKTRIEIWRQVAEMIRSEIGDAIWMGCGCPLWAAVGLVDGIRIGSDIGVEWDGQLSAQSLLRDLATRSFTNHILWQIDPDCILLRDRFHYLSDAEVNALALYAGMSGGMMLTSDALTELSPQRISLWKLIVSSGAWNCRFPFLGQSSLYPVSVPAGQKPGTWLHYLRMSDPVLVQVRGSLLDEQSAAVFLFNIGDCPAQRSYPLSGLGLCGPSYVMDWENGVSNSSLVEIIEVILQPHSGKLFFVSRIPITELPCKLPG